MLLLRSSRDGEGHYRSQPCDARLGGFLEPTYWVDERPGPREHLFRDLAGPAVRSGYRRDIPGRERRFSTHTVAIVSTMANEASAIRLAPVPP